MDRFQGLGPRLGSKSIRQILLPDGGSLDLRYPKLWMLTRDPIEAQDYPPLPQCAIPAPLPPPATTAFAHGPCPNSRGWGVLVKACSIHRVNLWTS